MSIVSTISITVKGWLQLRWVRQRKTSQVVQEQDERQTVSYKARLGEARKSGYQWDPHAAYIPSKPIGLTTEDWLSAFNQGRYDRINYDMENAVWQATPETLAVGRLEIDRGRWYFIGRTDPGAEFKRYLVASDVEHVRRDLLNIADGRLWQAAIVDQQAYLIVPRYGDGRLSEHMVVVSLVRRAKAAPNDPDGRFDECILWYADRRNLATVTDKTRLVQVECPTQSLSNHVRINSVTVADMIECHDNKRVGDLVIAWQLFWEAGLRSTFSHRLLLNPNAAPHPDSHVPMGYDTTCRCCGDAIRFGACERVRPDGDTNSYGVLVCWNCSEHPGLRRLKTCDSCSQSQSADGGFSGQVQVSSEGDVEEVFWQCQQCCDAGTGLVVV